MKESLYIFILFLIFSFSISVKDEEIEGKIMYQGYFYLQKLYPGVDPVENLGYSSNFPVLKYISLNEKFLYYTNSIEESRQIEGILKLKDLIDKSRDDIAKGKCCVGAKYIDYSKKKTGKAKSNLKTLISQHKKKKSKSSISSILNKHSILNKPNLKVTANKHIKKQRKLKTMKKRKYSIDNNSDDINYNHANYCLEVFSFRKVRWKICSVSSLSVYRMYLKLVYAIIKSSSKSKDLQSLKVSLNKFLSNSVIAPKKSNLNWSWNDQNQWHGTCKSSFMQSPQKIEKNNVNLEQISSLKITYKLFDSEIKIVKRGFELIVRFQSDPGLIKMAYMDSFLLFQPKYISFRFPGEHIILGKRYSGEILINCDEYGNNKNSRKTNGLIITIPLDNDSQYSNVDLLEDLNVDFWKFYVSKQGSYIPKSFIGKFILSLDDEEMIFKLSELITEMTEKNPLYYLYMGSLTSPPCEEYVYHLIINKPLKISTCQYKVIRENSLLQEGKRLIHARLIQNNIKDEKKLTKSSKTIKLNTRSIYAVGKIEHDPEMRLFVPIEGNTKEFEEVLKQKGNKDVEIAKSC